MNTPDFPTKEPGYRFLREGEVLREGDEFWWSFGSEWVEVKATLGLDIDKESVGQYRRPLK